MKYYFTNLTNREKVDFNEEDEEVDINAQRANTIFSLLDHNKDFCKTQLFYDLRDKLVEKLKNNLLEGHLLFHGTNATLFGNGPALLYASIALSKLLFGKYEEDKHFEYMDKLDELFRNDPRLFERDDITYLFVRKSRFEKTDQRSRGGK